MIRGDVFRLYSVPEDRFGMRDNPYPGYAGNMLIHLNKKNGAVQGTLTSLFYEKEIPFFGLDQLVLFIDAICRETGYPRDDENASFSSAGSRGKGEVGEPDSSGILNPYVRLDSYADGESISCAVRNGDIMLRISYREHRSLQGAFRSLESADFKPVRFRSALELMRLLDTEAQELTEYRDERSGFLERMPTVRRPVRSADEDLEQLGNIPEGGLFLFLMQSVRAYWNGQPVRMARRESGRVAQLIEIMALHPDGISKDALMDYFYGTEELSSRNNSLNNLIYRMRNQLIKLGLPEVSYLENRGGLLAWTSEVPIRSDVVLFREAVKRAGEAAGTDQEEYLLLSALDRYYGELLPQLANESWVIVENESLKQIYEQTAMRLLDLYMKDERFQEAYELCTRASEFFPAGDWDRRRVGLLIAMQRYRLAYSTYQEMTIKAELQEKSLTRQQMERDFEELGQAYNFRRDSIEEIMDHLRDRSDRDKAYRCLMPAFSDICHVMQRVSRLRTYWGSIVSITLQRENPGTFDVEDGGKVMGMLDCILGEVLSPLDIYTRYSRRQFLMLLPRLRETEIQKEENAIEAAFSREKESRGYRLEFAVHVIKEDI